MNVANAKFFILPSGNDSAVEANLKEALERFEAHKRDGQYDQALGIQKKMLDEDIDPSNPEDRKRLMRYRLELNAGMFEIVERARKKD